MKCIPYKMRDGTVVNATVDDDVDKLDQSDIEQLEAWVAYVKARHAKKKQPSKEANLDKDTK